VTRWFIALALALSLCLAGAAFADESAPPASAALPGAAAKAPSKSRHKTAAKPAKSEQSAEEADTAARLEEGRKKFFQRSMGFDNGGGADSPATLQGGDGLTPSMGFKF